MISWLRGWERWLEAEADGALNESGAEVLRAKAASYRFVADRLSDASPLLPLALPG